MSRLLVPSQYEFIQEALAAAEPGDSIVISEGIYFEYLNLVNYHDIVIRAAYGERVQISPPVTVPGIYETCIKLDNSSRITFRDIEFYLQDLGVDFFLGYDQIECRAISLIDCKFSNTGGVIPVHSVVRIGAGPGYRPSVIRRCSFVSANPGLGYELMHIIRVDGVGGGVVIENNALHNWHLSDSYSSFALPQLERNSSCVVVDFSSPSSADQIVIRHNAASVYLVENFIYVDAQSAGSKCHIYNNILNSSQPLNDTNTYVIDGYESMSQAVIRNNCSYSSGASLDNTFSPNTSNNTQGETSLGGVSNGFYEISALAGAYRSGVAVSGSENPAPVDYRRLPFYSPTPSRGQSEVYDTWDTKQALHLKYKNVDVTDGLTMRVGLETLVFIPERASYETPIEVAKHLEILISDLSPAADIEVWYDLQANVYKIQAWAGGTFTFVTSGFSRYLFGNGTS